MKTFYNNKFVKYLNIIKTMWNQMRSNRLTGEREQIKDHIMHIERLRQVKSTVDTRGVKKPSHMKQNYKKEL